MKKLTKRIIVLFVCMTLIFMQQTTLLAFADEQNETFNDVVVSKLGTDEYTVEVLYGFSGQATHLLAEGENCYLIFDTARQKFTEYSKNGNSPFYGLPQASVKIYLAPTYNYYVLNDVYYELPYSKVLDMTQISQLREVESEYRVLLNTRDTQQTQTRSSGEILDTAVFIDNEFYFRNMRNNIGSNTNELYPNSCGYVAFEMVLSYFDTFYNDNCIYESYDVTVEANFDTFDDINLEDYVESPGIDDDFHGILIEYAHTIDFVPSNSNLLTMASICHLIENYFEVFVSDAGLDITLTRLFTDEEAFCKNAIDSNLPIIAGFFPDGFWEIGHFVVGYGYQDDGLIAHNGYKYPYRDSIDVFAWDSIIDAIYFNITSSHICSNNYIWYAEGCSGSICPCGQYTCNHRGDDILEYNTTHHKYRCEACNVIKVTEQHIYVADGCLDICIVCGYTNIETDNHTFVANEIGLNICTICGYEDIANHNHTITYVSNNDRRTHNKVCVCGYVERQACVAMTFVGSNVKVCISCGQTLLSVIPPIIHSTNSTQGG